MIVYKISHTLHEQAEYVAAENASEAIQKLKKEYITSDFPNGRIEDKDILNVKLLGDLIV